MIEKVSIFRVVEKDKRRPTLFADFPDLRKLSDEELLELSIQKWEAVVEYTEKNPLDQQEDPTKLLGMGPSTCALCQRYWYENYEDKCTGCIVYKTTEVRWCDGTPAEWYFYSESLENAKKEIEFLKGLRK